MGTLITGLGLSQLETRIPAYSFSSLSWPSAKVTAFLENRKKYINI
jgi:hypothetical protein